MAGAVGMSMVGVGYTRGPRTPRVFVAEYLGHYHVCVKRTRTWWEIVVDTSDENIASLAAKGLQRTKHYMSCEVTP